MKHNARPPESNDDGRLLLMERHLAGVAGLRCEFSLQCVDGVISSRRKPLFWLGVSHRDSREKFQRIRAALEDLRCPTEILNLHSQHLDASLYQGIGLDMTTAQPSGTLFMHCRNGERIGLGWRGEEWRETRYVTGRLLQEEERKQLERMIHIRHRLSFSALLTQERVILEAGYWIQLRDGCAEEIYITLPWHPTLDDMQPLLVEGGYGVVKTPDCYANANVRHIGFSLRHGATPALTFYISAGAPSTWPRNLDQLESAIISNASALRTTSAFERPDKSLSNQPALGS